MNLWNRHAQLVNFIKDMILNGDGGAVITFRTDRKIRRKQGMGGVEVISIFSEPKEKVYRILFLKCRQLADNDSSRSDI